MTEVLRSPQGSKTIERKADAFAQRERILQYLPQLEKQLEETEQRADELRRLIVDEKRAASRLHAEGHQ